MKTPIIFKQSDCDYEKSAKGSSFIIHEWQGSGPDYMHVHYEDDEAWHILEGTMVFKFLGKEIKAGPGTTVFVPAGVPHTYFEESSPVRYLIILTNRIAALISELHETPYSDHAYVMQKYKSQIVDDSFKSEKI